MRLFWPIAHKLHFTNYQGFWLIEITKVIKQLIYILNPNRIWDQHFTISDPNLKISNSLQFSSTSSIDFHHFSCLFLVLTIICRPYWSELKEDHWEFMLNWNCWRLHIHMAVEDCIESEHCWVVSLPSIIFLIIIDRLFWPSKLWIQQNQMLQLHRGKNSIVSILAIMIWFL